MPCLEPHYEVHPLQEIFSWKKRQKCLWTVVAHLPATDRRPEEIKTTQKEDDVCTKLTELCYTGWPQKSELDPEIKPYWQGKMDFHLAHRLLMKRGRLVIPPPLRAEILQRLHEGHQGISNCRARAKESVWWPGISTQIGQMVERCETCQNIPTHVPDRPWQKVGIDLFEWSKTQYLLIIDFFYKIY